MTDLKEMGLRLQSADVHNQSRVLGTRDGKLDLNFMVSMKDGSQPSSDALKKLNPEHELVNQIIDETFGIKNSNVTYWICDYFDKLDKKDDKKIDLKKLTIFVKDIASKGAAKDSFLRYLEDCAKYEERLPQMIPTNSQDDRELAVQKSKRNAADLRRIIKLLQ